MIFIETSIFTKEIKRLLPDEEYRALQGALLLREDLSPTQLKILSSLVKEWLL